MFRTMRIGLNNPLTRSKFGFVLGTSSAIFLTHAFQNPYKNDYANSVPVLDQKPKIAQQLQQELKPKYDGAFGGKVNYQELSIGSFVGLFTGIVIGKLSHVLWALTLSSYLVLQWMNSRGIITFKFNRIVNFGTSQIDIRKMIFDRPSFNITFLLAFLISAWNV